MQKTAQLPTLNYYLRRSRFRIWRRLDRKYYSTFAMGAVACLFLLGAVILFRRATFAVAPPTSPVHVFPTYAPPAPTGPIVPAGTGGMTCVSYGIVLVGAFIGCGVKAVRLYFANTPHAATSAEASLFAPKAGPPPQ
jgi:hypothetical protein